MTPKESDMPKLHTIIANTLSALVILLAFASPATAEPNQCSPPHRAAMVEFAERYVDFYDQLSGNPDADYTEIYAPDAVLASTAGVYSGITEIAGIMSLVVAAIPDLRYQIENVWVDGNNFTVRYSYSGTHLGNFLGIPASGNSLKVYGLEVNTVEGGRIVHTHNFTDFFGLMVQMGAIAFP